MSEQVVPGTLYIVSTPIGNLADLSPRAITILSSVNIIAAEDTRTTGVLLKHFQIATPMISYHRFNEARRAPALIDKLLGGEAVALVSDAGTPGISDPAFRVVRSAIDAGIAVIAIPGAAAFLAALVVSGLPMNHFVFEGFLPVKKGRKTRLEFLKSEERTVIVYEAPHRLLRTLRDLREALGDREMAAVRELTKKFEEIRRGKISDIEQYFSERTIRGEFVLVLRGSGNDRNNDDGSENRDDGEIV